MSLDASCRESPERRPCHDPQDGPARSCAEGGVRRSAVGERCDRHAVVALAHAQLVGAAVRACAASWARRRRRAATVELERGDRAVDDVVLAAVRVGVAPARGRLRRGPRRAPRRRPPLAGSAQRAARRALGDPRAARGQAADAMAAPVERERAVGDPRASSARRPAAVRARRRARRPGVPAKPIPCSQIQRSACSEPQLWPTIPGQPRSSIGSRPGSSSDALEAGRGRRARQLRARQRRPVEPRGRQVAQLRLLGR